MKTKPLTTLLLLLSLIGCASTQSNRSAELNTSAYVWLQQTTAISAEQAFSGENTIFIKYRSFLKDSNSSKLFYGKAQWKGKEDEDLIASKNMSVDLNFLSKEDWESESNEREYIKLLSGEHWNTFKQDIISGIAIDEDYAGVVVRANEKEMFIYYDKQDQLQIVDVVDKPAEYAIKRTIDPDALAEITIMSLSEYLKELKIDEKRVLMTVSDTDDMSPFFYVDLDKKVAISLKIQSSEERYGGNVVDKSIKSADHLILNSHVFGLATRPFSSAFKLITWGKATAMDVVRPKRIALLESSEIPPVNTGEGMDLKKWESQLGSVRLELHYLRNKHC